jgi:hypothetical protein
MSLTARMAAQLVIRLPDLSHDLNSLCASGELLIRHCLERAFKDLAIYLEVIRSDEQFNSINMDKFDIIIVDPWTWGGKGLKSTSLSLT